MFAYRPVLLILTLLAVAGCATTSVETTGVRLVTPLCTAEGGRVSVAVFWRPHWRVDQKEPELREAAAANGLQNFLASVRCLDVTEVTRLPDADAVPSDPTLISLAAGHPPQPRRVLLLIVRELGPLLEIGLPMGVRGQTEVVLEVRLLDTLSRAVLANSRTVWRNGGTMVVKGTGTLTRDMATALRAALLNEGSQSGARKVP